jgi:heptosyltransferase III
MSGWPVSSATTRPGAAPDVATAAPVVLVFRPGHLGDTLVCLPALRAIRAAHPDARLVLLTDHHQGRASAMSWEVLRPTGLFDSFRALAVPGRIGDYAAAARSIRTMRPVRLYYLPPMPRTRRQALRDWVFFRLLCGIHDIVGLRPTGPYPVRSASGALVRVAPEAVRLLTWIAPTAGSSTAANGWIAPDAAHRAAAARIIEASGFHGHPLVAITPGSNMQAKRWPAERFEAVGRALLEHAVDGRLVLVGGPDEHALCDRLRTAWGPRALNLAGLGIWESAAILERCTAYVGNDTGVMHLAASVGTPCVAIFSARDNPGKWEPMGTGHIVLRHDTPCGGCGLATCVEHDIACLRAIEVDDVVTAACAVVERKTAEVRRA